MTNPNPNTATRFKEGNVPPRHDNRPWSIRNAIRREVARTNKDGIANAEAIAQAMVKHAIEGDVRAAEVLIEQVDGKVMQPNLNLELAAIQNMTEDELNAIVSGTHPLAASGSGSAGVEAEAGSESASGSEPQADNNPGSIPVPPGEGAL